MSGMWNNPSHEAEWERSERELLREAVASTDREINDSVFYNGDDEDSRNDNRSIVNEMSQSEDWEGNDVPDDELIRETTGEIPAGMSGLVPTRADDQLMAENRQLREMINNVARSLPEPERPDMFADPDGWREQLISDLQNGRDMRGVNTAGGPPPPDMFADPDGFREYVVNEAARRSGAADHTAERVNSSLQHAHQRHGKDFEQAYTDIVDAAQRNPRVRGVVQSIWDSPDPGSALMQAWSGLAGMDFAAKQFGNMPFAPGLRSMQRRSPHEGSARRSRGWFDDGNGTGYSREQLEEDSIADAAWQ